MKKLLTFLMLSFTAVSLVNCSSSKSASSSTAATEQPAAERIEEIKKSYTADQLDEGKVLTVANCQKCHKMKEPSTRSFDKLERVLPSMIKKANLTEQQGALVRAYMLANAKAS